MKRHSSVFLLLCRSTFYRVLGLIAAMAAAQTGLFWLALERTEAAADPRYGVNGVELVVDDSRMALILGAMLLLITALLFTTGWERGSRVGYTLRRLSVSERTVFVWQGVYNSLCCFLLWAAAALVAVALCGWYVRRVGPEWASGQTLFLAFYRSKYLHNLLPLGNGLGWARNLILVVCLGFSSAVSTYRQRRGKGGAEGVLMAVVAIMSFAGSGSDISSYLINMGLSLFVTAIGLSRVFFGEEDEHEA